MLHVKSPNGSVVSLRSHALGQFMRLLLVKQSGAGILISSLVFAWQGSKRLSGQSGAAGATYKKNKQENTSLGANVKVWNLERAHVGESQCCFESFRLFSTSHVDRTQIL